MTRLRHQARATFVSKVLAALISYGFAILLARVMAPEGFGQVAFFLNAAVLLSVLGACGQQIAMVRFVPPLMAWGDRKGALPDFVGLAYCRAILGAFVLYALAIALALLGVFAGLDPWLASIGFALIPAVGWIDIQSHFARGLQRVSLSLIPKEILWRGTAGLSLLAAWIWTDGQPLDTSAVLLVLLVALVLVATAQGAVLERLAGFRPRFCWRTGRQEAREWRIAAVPFWITSVSNIFLSNADVMTVALLFGPAETGIYFAANRLAQLLGFFVVSQNVVIGPHLARVWASGDAREVATIVHRATRAATLPTLATGAAMMVGAPLLLGLFGPGFETAVPVLQVLVLTGIVAAAGGPADITLNMCGHDRAAMRISAINLALAAAGLGLGGVFGGTLGVALAVLAATALRKAMYWAMLRQLMGLRSDVLAPEPRPASV